ETPCHVFTDWGRADPAAPSVARPSRNTCGPNNGAITMPAFRGRRAEGLPLCVSETANMGGIADVETAGEAGGLGPTRPHLRTGASRGERPGAGGLEDAECVRWPAPASWSFRRALSQGHRAHARRQIRSEVLRTGRPDPAARVLRRRFQ